MLTPNQIATIEADLARSRARTRLLDLDGMPVIVKQLEAPLKHWGYPVLDALASLLRQPMLRAVPAPGGRAAQQIEVARLRALAAAGVPVPEVLHATPQWLALSWVGELTLDQLLRRHPDIGQRYWESGLEAILALHRLGQTASQCFARNMLWHEGKISFIDFEDDPTQTMPLSSAQARDWVLYLHSTAYIVKMDPQRMADIMLRHLRKDDDEVRRQVISAAKTFGWLRILPDQRKPWGRDVVAVQAAARVMHLLVAQIRRMRVDL